MAVLSIPSRILNVAIITLSLCLLTTVSAAPAPIPCHHTTNNQAHPMADNQAPPATNQVHPPIGKAGHAANALISSPLGAASVYNNCPFAVHSNIVYSPCPNSDAEGGWTPPEEIYSTLSPGETAEHPFMHDPDMGVAWKSWGDGENPGGPVQFEYTWAPQARRVWWDFSVIDAGGAPAPAATGNETGATASSGREIRHPFAEFGLSLQRHINGVPVVNDMPVVMSADTGRHSHAGIGGAGVCARIECPAGRGFVGRPIIAGMIGDSSMIWGGGKAGLRVTLCG